jgi:tetratricopeptide (TPR) repeat protein
MGLINMYDTHSGICPNFLKGLAKFDGRDYGAALTYFRKADEESELGDFQNTYTSFHGLTRVYLNDREGIQLCRRAAHFERYDGDVYWNLALAELRLKHRQRAIEAIRAGLVIDASHKGLNKLRESIGVRRTPFISFLSRDHFINRLVGKWTYRKRKGASRR